VDEAFHRALFCMLLRYKALGGGGYQAALGGAVFDTCARRDIASSATTAAAAAPLSLCSCAATHIIAL
jgi:hypothetical protein